jgi:hypothetical protein
MKIKALAAILATTFVAGQAQAITVAGWGFHQYFTSGGLVSTEDNTGQTTSLNADFSDLDPTFAAGLESAAFGTLFFDGSFGSTAVDPAAFPASFSPSAAVGGSLVSNPTTEGSAFFNGAGTDGIMFSELGFSGNFAMQAASATTVVFAADLGSDPNEGANWGLQFAARTFSGAGSIEVEFSTDGVNFSVIGTETLSAVDSGFSVALGATQADEAYVRLSLSAGAFLDNVEITADLAAPVPEPVTALLGLTGVLGLGVMGRRRA